jgi:beta-phosphoglucomutase-like phosphatase (HAD superfamily)
MDKLLRVLGMKKLLLWDFDGVVADTEHTAMDAWREALKGYDINLSFEETVKCILGRGPKSQLGMLRSYNEQLSLDDIHDINAVVSEAVKKTIKITEGIEDIFKMKHFDQCIATGNAPEGIKARVNPLNLNRYFPESHLFSASFVKHGKPEPDLFLYAAEKMGYKPEECIVIEDSLTGLTAGLKAGMLTVAFIEHALFDKEEYIKEVKKLGVNHIFGNMKELKAFLDTMN